MKTSQSHMTKNQLTILSQQMFQSLHDLLQDTSFTLQGKIGGGIYLKVNHLNSCLMMANQTEA